MEGSSRGNSCSSQIKFQECYYHSARESCGEFGFGLEGGEGEGNLFRAVGRIFRQVGDVVESGGGVKNARGELVTDETQNSLYATVHVMPLRIYVNSLSSTTTTT